MIDDELRQVLTLTDTSPDASLAAAAASRNVDVLVAVAVRTGDGRLLGRAAEWATTSRARQVVALATAHLAGDHERFDALVRDHLVEHPDHVVAAWLAAVHRDHPTTPTTPDRENHMLTTEPTSSVVPRTTITRRPALRWLLTFAGFPLGAVAARAVVGPIDDSTAAVVGGLVTGAILGAAQGWALRPLGISLPRWLVATAVGLAAGLGIGAASIGFSTSMGALAAQGAICGAAVGTAQAVVLTHRDRRIALAWPFALTALWALGWTITTAIGVDVERHHAVFGSSGAITVTVLTAALPLALSRKGTR